MRIFTAVTGVLLGLGATLGAFGMVILVMAILAPLSPQS